jgi:hypothetical protein
MCKSAAMGGKQSLDSGTPTSCPDGLGGRQIEAVRHEFYSMEETIIEAHNEFV